jgi:hypothetical protein
MSHVRQRPARRLVLRLTASGGAELTHPYNNCRSNPLWASATDREFLEEFGERALDENDLLELTEYLIDCGHLTQAEADDHLRIDIRVLQSPAAPADPTMCPGAAGGSDISGVTGAGAARDPGEEPGAPEAA